MTSEEAAIRSPHHAMLLGLALLLGTGSLLLAHLLPDTSLASREASASEPPPGGQALFASGLPLDLDALPRGLASLSAQECNACHGALHQGWSTSAHRSAWNKPVFQAAVREMGDPPACRACHLPLASQHALLAADHADGALDAPVLSPNPAWSPTLQVEGVTCAACHVRDGVVVGVKENHKAPHPVEASSALASPETCAACHQLRVEGSDEPLYDTYGEWEASSYKDAGVRCQDCHMPPMVGAVTTGRLAPFSDHSFKADLTRALSVFLELHAPELQRGEPFTYRVIVRNTGAGHMVPTGRMDASLQLKAVVVSADGEDLHPPLEHALGGRASGTDRGGPDTRLPPLGERILEHTATIPQATEAQPAVLEVTGAGEGGEEVVFLAIPVTII